MNKIKHLVLIEFKLEINNKQKEDSKLKKN